MSSLFQDAKLTGFAEHLTTAPAQSLEKYRAIYENNRHRVYALAFWMTDNELAAEEVMSNTFERAFAGLSVEFPTLAAPLRGSAERGAPEDDSEAIDHALVAELRYAVSFSEPSLSCAPSTEVAGVRRNTKRVDLERAVVQLPPTERLVFLMHDVEAYDYSRIARLLGINELESRTALHQARLRIRELLASLQS
jgi:RNA polymerase sigma-70 factor, ECF subfamily